MSSGKLFVRGMLLFGVILFSTILIFSSISFAAVAGINVLSPNGGESMQLGSPLTIRWDYTGNPGPYVKIELLWGYGTYKVIHSSAPIGSNGSGSYDYSIPVWFRVGSYYKVKVTSTSNSAYTDTGDNYFSITATPPVPTIKVSSPNGGETWQAGTTQTIRWTYASDVGTSVTIHLLRGGASNSVIASNVPIGSGGSGSYIWKIPASQTAASNYNVKVITDTGYSDAGDGNFSITTTPIGPSITVISPNGGESVQLGSPPTIRWAYTGNPGSSVKVELLWGYGTYKVIHSSAPIGSNGSGSLVYTIPIWFRVGSYYKVKVTSTSNSAYTDTGDNYFSITATPPVATIKVSSPNGGESWQAGSTQTIRWSYTGSPGSDVKIELLNGGVPSSTITSSTPIGSGGSGFYIWAIPPTQVPGLNYRVRVTSTSNGAYTDTSDKNFTLTAPPPATTITVTSPNGGENWKQGSTQVIRWSYMGDLGSAVKIELLQNGELAIVISASTSVGINGAGSYSWIVPSAQTPGTNYMIRVTSTSDESYTDTSSTYFSITAPSLDDPPPDPCPDCLKESLIKPIIYIRDDWANRNWTQEHSEWGETGGWWEQWQVDENYDTSVIYTNVIPYLEKAKSMGKMVGVGIWFKAYAKDISLGENFVKTLNEEINKFDNCQFFVIAGGSQYGEFGGGTENFAYYLIDIFEKYMTKVPFFVQGGTSTCGYFSGRAMGVESQLMGVKANGLHVEELNEYLWVDNDLVGGMLGFSKLYHEYIHTALEHKIGWTVEESYDVLMKGLSNHIDFFSFQPCHVQAAYDYEKKYGFPLLAFVREHLGIRRSNAKSAWIVFRDCLTGRNNWDCYVRYDGKTVCGGPQPDDYQFYLTRRDDLPNSSTLVLKRNEATGVIPELPLPARNHPYAMRAIRKAEEYVYLDIDDGVFQDKTRFRISLTFVNHGTGKIHLEHKNKDGEIITKSVTKGPAIGLVDQWVDYEWVLEDAVFNNGFDGKADFRINCYEGPEYLNRLIIRAE